VTEGIADGAIEELRGEVRLAQIVGGARVHGLQVEPAIAKAGEHDERDVPADRSGRGANQFEPAARAQAVIDQGHVDRAVREPPEAIGIRRAPQHLITIRRDEVQHVADERVLRFVVVDEQQAND
jgi:hypothetical protein